MTTKHLGTDEATSQPSALCPSCFSFTHYKLNVASPGHVYEAWIPGLVLSLMCCVTPRKSPPL